MRSCFTGMPGNDLIIRVQDSSGQWAVGGDEIVVKDWFESARWPA